MRSQGKGLATFRLTTLVAGGALSLTSMAPDLAMASMTDKLLNLVPSAIVPPIASTGFTTHVRSDRATLNGTISPNGNSGAVTFDIGASLAYGVTVSAGGYTPNPWAVGFNVTPTGLACGTLYYYRINASYSLGVVSGVDRAFSTAPCTPPVVTTGGATAISSNGATLVGSVQGNNTSGAFTFQIGATTAYGMNVSAGSYTSGSGAVTFTAPVTGLACGTTYHFRATAQSSQASGAVTFGANATFTTAACTTSPTTTPTSNPTPTPEPGGESAPTLLSPLPGALLEGTTTTFKWLVPASPPGTTSSLHLCTDPSFSGSCSEPRQTLFRYAMEDHPSAWGMTAAGAGAGAGGLLFFTGGVGATNRRRFYRMGALALMLGAATAGCGSSGDDGSGTTNGGTGDAVLYESDQITLASNTTYYWKVVTTQKEGATFESDVNSFTTGSGWK